MKLHEKTCKIRAVIFDFSAPEFSTQKYFIAIYEISWHGHEN